MSKQVNVHSEKWGKKKKLKAIKNINSRNIPNRSTFLTFWKQEFGVNNSLEKSKKSTRKNENQIWTKLIIENSGLEPKDLPCASKEVTDPNTDRAILHYHNRRKHKTELNNDAWIPRKPSPDVKSWANSRVLKCRSIYRKKNKLQNQKAEFSRIWDLSKPVGCYLIFK